MQKTRAGIYPFDESIVPVMQHADLFDKVSFCRIIGHDGSVLHKSDIMGQGAYARAADDVCWDMLDSDGKMDMLIVTPGVCALEPENAMSVIGEYCQDCASVLLLHVGKDLGDEISSLCTRKGCTVVTDGGIRDRLGLVAYDDKAYLYEDRPIETPIVSVSGVLPRTQKYQIQLDLLDRFQKDGYKVSLVGTGCWNELLGGYSSREVLERPSASEERKIKYFHSFLATLEEREHPDVVIVGIDDPLLPLSAKHTFNYGIYASELYSAFRPDVSIVSIMNGQYNDDFFNQMDMLCRYKYNFETAAYFVSRYAVISSSLYRDQLAYAFTEEVSNHSDKYSVYSDSDIKVGSLYGYVLQRLQQYGRCRQF